MSKKLRIALAQQNMFVGDIQGNLKKHIDAINEAKKILSADVIVFPELSMTGYSPEDLLYRKDFLSEAEAAVATLKNHAHGIYCIVGHPHPTSEGLRNACSVLYDGEVIATYYKQHLPNYGVFDEDRYFVPGQSSCIVSMKGIPVGITICEDLWFEGPIERAAADGARIILSPNASPFEMQKHEQRKATIGRHAKMTNLPIVYVNCVGGQDDLVFDGGSMVLDQQGEICHHSGFFQETLQAVDVTFTQETTELSVSSFSLPDEDERAYQALVLAVRDYVHHNHFKGALIGVSGGIDSALTLAIAVDALGKENVTAIVMPSRYTSEMSLEDGMTLIKQLGVAHQTLSIEPTYESLRQSLSSITTGALSDLTEQNLQSRCRGMIIMAISNQTGKIVLATSNRSELAVGYATLYGDMSGGFAVIKDVPKMQVYRLAQLRNKKSAVIPERIITRAPSAELAPHQKDEDTLPPYPVLDAILDCYITHEWGIDAIVARGFDKSTVEKVVGMIHKSEYKRRQAAFGPRLHPKAFGRDRRYPVSSGFKG